MDTSQDVVMKEEPLQEAVDLQADLTDPNPPPQPLPPNAAQLNATSVDAQAALQSIAPALATTPVPTRPGSIPPATSARPEKPVAHGGPTRQYLNQNVTPHLLEGMKFLAMNAPEKPLTWLADFLKERSKQVEG